MPNLRVAFAVLLFCAIASITFAEIDNPNSPQRGPTIDRLSNHSTAQPDYNVRVHRAGRLWVTMTNRGIFGNSSVRAEYWEDPEYGGWAPQAEFPGGEDQQYLFMGSLWVGALVTEGGTTTARVSTGTEGWIFPAIREFNPSDNSPIIERSKMINRVNGLGDFVSSPDAISDQDFIAVFTDTLTDPALVNNDPFDGAHQPLGIKVTRTSHSWAAPYASDFIIMDYTIENIGDNNLQNVYVGMYIDGDVGANVEQLSDYPGHTDDLTGYLHDFQYPQENGSNRPVRVNVAWIGDNDGRPVNVNSGNDFSVPHVTGMHFLKQPGTPSRESFNWWMSNGDPSRDIGPAWQDDGSNGDWTERLGTPLGDGRKYFLMQNREFDYNQVHLNDPIWIGSHPQVLVHPGTGGVETHDWRIPDAENADDIVNGYDTRYLHSFGPLGNFDYVDENGEDVYRLQPGETIEFSVAYVAAENFHDRNNPQPTNSNIDPSRFNLKTLVDAVERTRNVYDSPMVDTDGDGWYGEDTGPDLLFADQIGDTVVVGGQVVGIYPGPDFGELDGFLDPSEDNNPYKPAHLINSSGNMVLDAGDGVPDYQGPSAPPVPRTQIRFSPNQITFEWEKSAGESPFYLDPATRVADFEGYRIYESKTGEPEDWTLLEVFDRVNYAYLNRYDELYSEPFTDISGLPTDTIIDDEEVTLKKLGPNTGMTSIWDGALGVYRYELEDVHPLRGMWYAVTTYDCGDPVTHSASRESDQIANAVYFAPSGDPAKEPMVVPNPYRADQNYTDFYPAGMPEWVPENNHEDPSLFATGELLWFYNLPEKCLIRIFTVSGELVQIVAHNQPGDLDGANGLIYAEPWNLLTRDGDPVVSGLYLFSVEDKTDAKEGELKRGKFVVIR